MNTEKEKILNSIKAAIGIDSKSNGRNSMGVSENYYNAYYLIGKCFDFNELSKMSEKELKNLLKLADFASDVFY